MAEFVQLSFEADLKGTVQKFLDVARAVRETEGGVKQLTREVASFGRQAEQGGGKASASMQALTQSLVGVATQALSIGGLVDLLRQANEEGDKAAGTIERIAEAQKKLNAAAASPGEMQRLDARARMIAVAEGVAPERAAEITAKARREGLTAEAGLAARAEGVLGLDALQVLELTGRAQEAFPGEKLGVRELLNTVVSGARAGEAAPEDVLAAFDKLGPAALKAGVGSAELASLMTVMAQGTTPKAASASVQALLRGIGEGAGPVSVPATDAAGRLIGFRQRAAGPIEGATLAERIDKLAASGAVDQEGALGRALTVYQTNRGRIAELTGAIGAAQRGPAIDREINKGLSDPNIAQLRATRGAENLRDLTLAEKRGLLRLVEREQKALGESEEISAGIPAPLRMVSKAMIATDSLFGLGADTAAFHGRLARGVSGERDDVLIRTLNRLAAAIERDERHPEDVPTPLRDRYADASEGLIVTRAALAIGLRR